MPGARQNAEMREPRDTVVADLGIIGVDIENQRGAILGRQALFVREELAAVNLQILTATPRRGDAAILWPVDHRIAQKEGLARRGKVDAATVADAQELDVVDLEFRQAAGQAAEIQHVFVALEGESAGARRRPQRLAQIDGARRDVLGLDVDLAPDAGAADPRTKRDVGDIGHRRQPGTLRGRIGRNRSHRLGIPGRSGQRGDLAVRQDAALRKAGQPGQGGHVDRLGQLDPPPVQVQLHMVGKVEQCLQRLLEPRQFAAEGRRIGVQIVVAGAGKPLAVGHRQPALELHRIVDGQVGGDEVISRRHDHALARGRRIRRLEGGKVIAHAVALGTVVAHIHPVEHDGMKDCRDILDDDILDPHHAAIGPGQIQTQMAVNRCRAPDHIDALPVARTDDGAQGDDRAVSGQRHGRPDLIRCGHIAAAGIARPTGDAQRWQRARDRLDLDRDLQIQPRLDRDLLKAAQLLGGLGLFQLQTAAKVLIRRHERRVRLGGIRPLPWRSVLARPQVQPRRERRRHQHQPFGNRLVHVANPRPLPSIPGGRGIVARNPGRHLGEGIAKPR